MADKDRAAREAALLAEAKRAAAERRREAPLNAPAAAPKATAPLQLSPEERLARLMEAEHLEREPRTARTKRNAMIFLVLFAVPILLWLLLSLLRR